ncbi:nucleoside diphosphate kinase regulator [Halomonas binhaiensis]|uniref:Nucleoside diphosphate kinase regulator n=1 Tax=Halomonas binhaiensis TaxID=2562282 RepID=A0A5C1NLZ4_9GAMM|nr:nucleoside diphosphate kinase regulator [Halomonas binhaiensis]QEM83175.1 nucleoside diphosphate kinase regulator [Halomonas binhaiensis]
MHSPRVINRLDVERLQRLIDAVEQQDEAVAETLEEYLLMAEVMDPEDMPSDVVSMNSQVRITDVSSGESLARTLVYPHALASTPGAISVMAPLGASLLGRRLGEQWDGPRTTSGVRRWRLEEILWQPEREHEYHR